MKIIIKNKYKSIKYIKIRKNAIETAKKFTWKKRAFQMIAKI